MLAVVLGAGSATLSGCAGGGAAETRTAPGGDPAQAPRPGTSVVGLDFLYAFENVASAAYYPLEGLAGCEYSPDGTLIVCDQTRGKVYGLEASSRNWYEFDNPGSRPYRPVDVQVDGFKVLVLDTGGYSVFRFDLSGSWQDQLLDIRQVDPVVLAQPSAFSVDRDGRMVIADIAQQQVLLLDTFLNLNMRLGEPGTLGDQFQDPSGIAFLPDGSIVVSDRGNRRLSWYGRLGFFETTIGGEFDLENPFVAPQGLDCDRFGNLFVADQGNGQIHILDVRLRPVFSAGRDFALQGTPVGPVDVAVGPDNLLAVTDRARSAILVYRIVYE